MTWMAWESQISLLHPQRYWFSPAAVEPCDSNVKILLSWLWHVAKWRSSGLLTNLPGITDELQTTSNPSKPFKALPKVVFFFFNCINLFLNVLGLHCRVGFSLVVCVFLMVTASLVWDMGLCASVAAACGSIVGAPRLWSSGSIVAVHGLSCSKACGIFPAQGSNPCFLLLAGGFFTTSHQGCPRCAFNYIWAANHTQWQRNECVLERWRI